MNISLIILTYNRRKAVMHTLRENLFNAGYPVHEIIHVDNGSDDQQLCNMFREVFRPSVQIKNLTNTGVAKGYNRGYLNATGSHVLITGIDRLFPMHWLYNMVHHFEKIPNTGVISIYAPPVREGDHYPTTRFFGEPELEINGCRIQPAIPFEARMCSREFFLKCGFLREDFEMYGYEDNEWGMRANRVAKELGMINYIIPSLYAQHFQEEQDFIMDDGRSYKAYKDSFLEKNRLKYEEIEKLGFPYYNPFF